MSRSVTRAVATLQQFAQIGAVELRLDFFRESPDTPVRDSMPLEMLSESLVLGALLLAEPLNLHQICYHSSSV